MLPVRLFNQGRSGWMRIETRLELGEFPNDLKFKLPCVLSASGRNKLVITDVAGLEDSVKFNMGYAGYDVKVQTFFGDYDPPQFSTKQPLASRDHLADLAGFCRQMQGQPVKAADEEGFLASLGISYLVIESFHVNQDDQRPGVMHVNVNCKSELQYYLGAVDLLPEEET